MARLDGKVAVVTGGASGLGAGFAARFVAENARVVAVDINEEGAQSVCRPLGESAIALRGDVSVEQDVRAAIDRAMDEFGRLDIVVNNAGILGVTGPIATTDADQWDRTIAVLLRSVFLGIKHAARIMRPQGSGSIINVASTAGVQGGLGPHAYTAAKHGVVGLTKSCAVELAQHNVRVNAICPGATLSGMTAGVITGDPANIEAARASMSARKGRVVLPEDIAGLAVFLASDEAWHVNGQAIVIDGTAEVLANKSLRYSE
jgi:NAD(P)-dependent dehydrogenase (short-subunit alcohol dehydrogenase family)